MRHGRAKASRRTLQFYRLNAPHIKPPYKLLLDGTFLVASIRNKVPLFERFAKILQNETFTCYVTRSTLVELETLSKRALSKRKGKDTVNNVADEMHDFFAEAKQYGLDECEIIESDKVPSQSSSTNNANDNRTTKDFSEASNDIYRLATEGGNNRHGYFIATQDDTLADALRAMPYVPLFRLGRAVLLLEAPSSASRSYTGNIEQHKLASAGGLMTEEERQMVKAVNKRDKSKRKETMKMEQEARVKRSREEIGGSVNVRRKKKAKGPNPLSCKSKTGR